PVAVGRRAHRAVLPRQLGPDAGGRGAPLRVVLLHRVAHRADPRGPGRHRGVPEAAALTRAPTQPIPAQRLTPKTPARAGVIAMRCVHSLSCAAPAASALAAAGARSGSRAGNA